MVIPDFSSFPSPANKSPLFQLPTVSDRFLALVIDISLFYPIIEFLVSGLLFDARNSQIQQENSTETMVARFLFFVAMIVLSIFFQAVCTFFWSATPGQKILKLKVVSLTLDNVTGQFRPLTFLQCLLRSALFWVNGMLFLGLPFLEIMGHPQRRCLHERASDTMVTSLYPTRDAGPTPFEQRIIGTWLRLSFLLFAFYLTFTFAHTQQMVKAGAYLQEDLEEKGYTCDVDTEGQSLSERLDILLTTHLIEPNEDGCLEAESDIALWNHQEGDKAMGYLVKLFVEEDVEKKKEYQSFICEKFKDAEACQVSDFAFKKGEGDKLRRQGLGLHVSRYLLMQERLAKKELVGAAALLEDLMKSPVLQPMLQKAYVNLAWQVRDGQSARAPANQEDQHIIKLFKKRFAIP